MPTVSSSDQCPQCGKRVFQGAKACPYCGWTSVQSQTPQPPPPVQNIAPPVQTQAAPQPQSPAGAGGAIVTLLVIGGAWWLFSSYHMPNSATAAGQSAGLFSPATRQVEYKVDGTAVSASLTYESPQGGTVQTTVSLPWENTQTFRDGDFLYLAAQNEGASGSVRAQIIVDGQPWKDTTSDGEYTIATCSGGLSKP